MNLVEIKNNLAKLSYTDDEQLILGRFIVFVNPEKSYVGQIVNLKSDAINNFAIARLIFTFNNEGIVENYDGSIPPITSEIGNLPSSELINILSIETPIKIGYIAQTTSMLKLDVSIFEQNFTVFCENDLNRKVFISNCIRQLFQMKEKSVVVDTSNMFEDYPRIILGRDFKLPLNSKMIDYIFEHDLAEIDTNTKAVIQDIFYAVQQYIETLDFKFIPIDNFVDVVTNQYKQLQMPELALLKNRLLKYRDANILANKKEEVLGLANKLKEKNCSIIDIKDIDESLQKEVLSALHQTLETFDKYIYLFVPLTDENSDKKLLKQFINHNRIFTTMFVSSDYKYASELKQHAQNIILFTPKSYNNDFAAYNTFLNKLNPDECIVFGKLTQGIPFIVEMNNLKTDLTQDDVLGDRYQFIPVTENLELVHIDDEGNKIPVRFNHEEEAKEEVSEEIINSSSQIETEPAEEIPEILEEEENSTQEDSEIQTEIQSIEEGEEGQIIDEIPLEESIETPQELEPTEIEQTTEDLEQLSQTSILEPTDNILADNLEQEELVTEEYQEADVSETENKTPDITEETQELTEEDLDFLDANSSEFEPQTVMNDIETQTDEITDNIDIEDMYPQEDDPTVPIYPSQDDSIELDEDFEFAQGDTVEHKTYGRGVIEKIIKYGNKTLCSITFENNIGRRLLDPTITELVKI